MRFEQLVETSRRVSNTRKRLEKIAVVAALLKQLRGEEIEIAAAYLSGRARQGKIGVGYGVLHDADTEPAERPELEISDVDRALARISEVQGAGSERRRVDLLRELFARCTAPEQEFLRGFLVGELRQGALAGIMLEAVAKASGVPLARARQAAMAAGEVTAIARSLLEKGGAGLADYEIRLFHPVQPMLAQTADEVAEALDDLGEAALEFKLDGARVQAHKSGGDVAIFSRALNDVTAAAPEIAEAVRALPVKDLILDGEAISLKPDGRPQPFQVTARRFNRKIDVEKMRAELPLSPFWFDLLYADGGNLLYESQARRFSELARIVPEAALIPHTRTSEASAGHEFLQAALEGGHEGIMAKSLSSEYAAGARGRTWLKVKHVRTLDLVILAAEWGSGRRRGWLSNLHLGARDVEKGGFAMLGKTFKGLTDEMLAWQTAELKKIAIARDARTVYVEPKLVAEIAFNDVQASPRYASGLALRFARVKRYRPDKTAAEADTLQTVKKLFAV
ncbi:MAG TPA: ATP-dependent DNA ligase [Bryobacteraceae bacterium]|jgi:DNA ligase-1|nr:ATP-dependent DNA ligase [Bryobacteraceae bacterium]